MLVTKFRAALAAAAVVAATATGAGVFARQAPADRPAAEPHHGEAEKDDGDEALDRQEALRLDVDYLTVETGLLKSAIDNLMNGIIGAEISIDEVKAGTAKEAEALKAGAAREVDAMKKRLNDLRRRYVAKSKELRHKSRELAALQRGRRPPADRPEPRRGVPELERQIGELNQKLDRVLKALEDLKRDRDR
jgi:hypothetical protein